MLPGEFDVRRGILTTACVAGVVLILGVVVLEWVAIYRARGDDDIFALYYGILGPVAYLVPGLVLLLRRDWHIVGWLLLLFGMGTAFTFSGGATYPIGGEWLLLIEATYEGSPFWYPMIALLLVFPDGIRSQTPRQRRVAQVVLAIAAVPVVLETLAADVGVADSPSIPNPLSIGFVPEPVEEATIGVTILALAAAFVSLVVRYRSAPQAQRRQYRWVLSAMGFLVMAFAVGLVGSSISGFDDLSWIPIMFAYILLPVA